MKWQPDMTVAEFQTAISAGLRGHECLNRPGINKDAIFIDPSSKTWRIHLPWREKIVSPQFQTVLEGHLTHRNVVEGIYHIHDSILDVGGFDGNWIWLFEAKRKVVLDVCCEALERWAAIHVDEIYCEDAASIGELFKPEEFDVVLLLDIVEHLEPGGALACIEAAERIAKYQVIVVTPDGYLVYNRGVPSFTLIEGVPCVEAMEHQSGWPKSFFGGRGYKIVVQPGQHWGVDALVCFYNKWEM